MGLSKYDKYYYGPGIYFWRSPTMAREHFIFIQISEYKNTQIAPGKYHVEMLLPVSGGFYDYKYCGPIEEMPNGYFWGPIETPK